MQLHRLFPQTPLEIVDKQPSYPPTKQAAEILDKIPWTKEERKKIGTSDN